MAVAMPNRVVVAVENKGYSQTKISEITLVNVPTCVIKIPNDALQYNDVRLNSFNGPDSSGTATVSYVEICNRNGSPGTVGAGTHFVVTVPLPTNLPSENKALSVISNPYDTVYFKNFMYINDYDEPNLWAVNVPGFTLANEGNEAYIFDKYPNNTCSGVALEAVGDNLYALFNISTGYLAPYIGSNVVKLTQTGDIGELIVEDPEEDFLQVGFNTLSMCLVSNYLWSEGTEAKDYLLISAIGGNQGTGNGALSHVDVIDVNNWQVLTNPIEGTYNNLDIKSVTCSPTESNDAFIWIMAGSYASGFTGMNFMLVQTTASILIENAEKEITENLTNSTKYVRIIPLQASWGGYFWACSYVSSSVSGIDGHLIVGLGNNPNTTPTPQQGDRIWIYPVDNSGANVNNVVEFDSTSLYGASTCAINTMTIAESALLGKKKCLRSDASHIAIVQNLVSKADLAPSPPDNI